MLRIKNTQLSNTIWTIILSFLSHDQVVIRLCRDIQQRPTFHLARYRTGACPSVVTLTCALWRQVLEYLKLEDFEGADAAALQGPDGRARCESLRLTSHMLQATRSQEGTIVTVKDLINLPREVHSHSFVMLVHWTSANAVSPQTKQQQPGRQVVLSAVLGAAWIMSPCNKLV